MFPRRGALGTALTAAILLFLLNFKTPDPATSSADMMSGGMPTDAPSLPAFSTSADPSSGSDIAAAVSPGTPTAAPSASDPSPVATSGVGGSPGSSPTQGGTYATSAPSAGPRSTPTAGRTPAPGTPAPGSTPTPGSTQAPGSGSTPSPTSPPATQPPTPRPTQAPPSTPAPAGFSGSIDGAVVQTQFGPMQVRVVWSGGKITDVITLQSTNSSSRSVSISSRACPILRSEALRAQSAAIDTVSGATYTSSGYKSSLQSALSRKP